MIHSKSNYSAWLIKDKDYNKASTIEEKIIYFLRYGILAPSTHNTQPWKFKINKNIVTIYPDWKYRLPYGDVTDSNIFISLGCCITNIVISAAYYGYKTNVSFHNVSIKRAAYAKIVFLKQKSAQKSHLSKIFPSITKRFSNKLIYNKKQINGSTIKNLSVIGKKYGVEVLLINESSFINFIAKLYLKAAASFHNNTGFRRELSSWLRYNRTSSGDGMPGFVTGASLPQSLLGKYFIKYIPSLLKIIAKKDKISLEKSPVIGLIINKQDDIHTWINTGRAYEEIILTGTTVGIQSTVMAAIMQHDEVESELLNLINKSEYKLHMFFRMGYSNNKGYHTPRRKIDTFLI